MKKVHWVTTQLKDEFLLQDEKNDVVGNCIMACDWEWWAYLDDTVKAYGIELTSDAAKAEVESWLKRHGVISEVVVVEPKQDAQKPLSKSPWVRDDVFHVSGERVGWVYSAKYNTGLRWVWRAEDPKTRDFCLDIVKTEQEARGNVIQWLKEKNVELKVA